MLRMEGRTHGWMDNVKTVYPPKTKFAGGINISEETTGIIISKI